MANAGGLWQVGPRFQKEHNGYWFNGLRLSYAPGIIEQHNLAATLDYASSRWGSAWGGEGVSFQDKVELAGTWHFRPGRWVDPRAGLSLGYYYVDTEGFQLYESNHALTFSLLAGLSSHLHPRFGGPYLDMGYYLLLGPGVSFPLYFSLGWQVPLPWSVL